MYNEPLWENSGRGTESGEVEGEVEGEDNRLETLLLASSSTIRSLLMMTVKLQKIISWVMTNLLNNLSPDIAKL